MLKIERDVPDLYLDLAEPEHREICKDWLGDNNGDTSWEYRQLSFLNMVDRYISDEIEKSLNHRINTHEAGGRWRIAFPHVRTRTDTSAVRGRKGKGVGDRKKETGSGYFFWYSDQSEGQ